MIPFCSLVAAAGPFDISSITARKFLAESGPKPDLASGIADESVDNSIVPKEYLIGGGDAFRIGIIGLPSHEYGATVDPDGNLYIGDVGLITLGKIPLTEAIVRIKKSFRASLKGRYDVYVMLKKCKRPVVTMVGALSNPGSYRLDGTRRLLDAVMQGNQGQLPSYGEANLRQVRCGNGDSVKVYDLLKALSGGDASQNPYLYTGDRIEVPNTGSSVCIGGELTGLVQGRIPLIPGETLGDVLPLLARRNSADTGYVMYRSAGSGPRKIPLHEASSLVLIDNDVITIPSLANFGSQDTVLVSGEALRPGTYPIERGKTTAQDILDFAGQGTPQASMNRVFIVRSNKLMPPGTAYLPSKANALAPPRWASASSAAVRPEINASLNDMIGTGDFAVISLESNPPSAVKLEGGDEIHVPRKEEFVYVSGNVRSPGAYPFKGGEPLLHYISLAKGYTSLADKPNIVVMRYYNGIAQLRSPESIEEGDVIVVPASVENKRVTTVYLPLVQTLATIASLALTYIAVTRAR
ncbi:MAG: SLBB domain-containing protein [Fibrobacteres bacterium]|nr:SLBB domain-containing protein [Fibrobacterota bacterium]